MKARATADSEVAWSLSDWLTMLDLHGRTWCIVEIRSSAGFSLPPNDAVMFYTCLLGTARLAGARGGRMILNPGDLGLVLSGEAHAVRTATNSPTETLEFLAEEGHAVDAVPTFTVGATGPVTARLLCGRLKPRLADGLRRMALPWAIRSEGDDGGLTDMRLRSLEATSTGHGAAALLTRFASLIMAMTLRNHPDCSLIFRQSAVPDPITRAVELIKEDPSADWSVAGLAHRVGLGRSTFAARFAAEVGQTPKEIVTEQRMPFAARLLKQSKLKICEVSARSGYQSEAAFSRRFAHFFGIPPGQMRRDRPDGDDDRLDEDMTLARIA